MMRPEQTKCPHDDIQFCPLYVAAHGGGVVHLTCCYGGIEEHGCAVDRSEQNYAAMLAALFNAAPMMVRGCNAREQASITAAQRSRNMRVNGVH